MQKQSLRCVPNMRMRKVKWAVEYLPISTKRIASPEKQVGKWKELLNTDVLHVEIGCGKGNYSIEMAKKYPTEGFIAVEKNESAAGIAAKKIDEENLDNLCLIHGDADKISTWFEKGEIDVIHLNFSDPWPKKRYAKRRLSSKTFLDQYKELLSSTGSIQMKTDNSSLFEYSVLMFLQSGFVMQEISVDYRRDVHDEDAITEYEQKFMDEGQPIYRVVFTKQ